MRYIPTSAAMVDSLKKQARKLQGKSGGKHAELLDRVAKSAGYSHWHYVTLCAKDTQAKRGLDALQADCDIAVRAARAGIEKIIVTGPQALAVPLMLFASQGDAWLLDPDGNMALCLMFHGEAQNVRFEDSEREVRIPWDGTFALDGEAFAVSTGHPVIGTRTILGYPLAELRRFIDKAQSFDTRFTMLILQEDAVDLTPELVARLIEEGWDAGMLDVAARDSARYSPS